MLALDQVIFFLSFFTCFFLLIPFGETPLGIVLMGIIVGIFLFFRHKVKITFDKDVLFPFLVLLMTTCFVFLSLTVTLSIPLTLNNAIFYLFSFLCFSFFLFVDKKWLNLRLVMYGFVLLGTTLSLLVFLFLIFPFLGKFLPPVNLLFANYGHNHASILLLFILPFSFLVALENQHKKYGLIPLFLIVIAICLSFGRVTIMLTLLELAVFGFWSSSALRKKLFIVFLPLSIFLFIILGMSAVYKTGQNSSCLVPIFKTQLCKSLITETRPSYWLEALKAIQSKPLSGWGGGTFVVLSRLFASSTYDFSAYAHNGYLQFIAEYGVVTSLFLFVFLALLSLQGKKYFHRSYFKLQKPEFFLTVSIFSLLIDGLLDYNWSYLAVWSSLMIGGALLLREKKEEKRTATVVKSRSHTNALILMSTYGGASIIILWSVLYICSTVLWDQHQYTKSLQVFPFVYWRIEEVVGTDKISPAFNNSLLRLYTAHFPMWRDYLDRTQEPQVRQRAMLHLLQLDYLNIELRTQLFYELYKQKQWTELLTQMKTINKIYAGNKRWEIPESQRNLYVGYSLKASNEVLETDPHLGVQILKELYYFYPEQTNDLPIPIVFQPEKYDPAILEEYLSIMPNSLSVWSSRSHLRDHFMRVAQQAIIKENYSDFAKYYKRVYWLGNDEDNQMWDSFSSTLAHQFDTFFQANNLQQAQITLDQWKALLDYCKEQKGKEQVFQFYKLDPLYRRYVKLGNTYADRDVSLTMKNYLSANEVSPFALNEGGLFFQVQPEKTVAIATYVKLAHQAGKDEILLPKEKVNVQFFQNLANQLTSQQSWDLAQAVTATMSDRYPQDYWASAQNGNLYFWRGEYEAARKAYQDCLKKADYQPTDCSDGLKLLDQKGINGSTLYKQASEGILINNPTGSI
jgi:O-antigen ligase